ncbi:MAG: TlpA disulfide reductase family protein [Fulvivirga sp.]|nr:TlpA disulfide reductase family protein [Fulvivirga sp.]
MKKIIYFLTFLLFFSCNSTVKEQTESVPAAEDAVIQLKSLSGTPIDLNKYKGKAIFVNLWATWCAPCIKEMPSLVQMEDQLRGEPVVFFYASNEPLSKIKQFAEKKPWDLNYTQLDMPLESLDVYGLPTTFIIDSKGQIVFKETGMRAWNSPETIEEIKSLITQN